MTRLVSTTGRTWACLTPGLSHRRVRPAPAQRLASCLAPSGPGRSLTPAPFWWADHDNVTIMMTMIMSQVTSASNLQVHASDLHHSQGLRLQCTAVIGQLKGVESCEMLKKIICFRTSVLSRNPGESRGDEQSPVHNLDQEWRWDEEILCSQTNEIFNF